MHFYPPPPLPFPQHNLNGYIDRNHQCPSVCKFFQSRLNMDLCGIALVTLYNGQIALHAKMVSPVCYALHRFVQVITLYILSNPKQDHLAKVKVWFRKFEVFISRAITFLWGKIGFSLHIPINQPFR